MIKQMALFSTVLLLTACSAAGSGEPPLNSPSPTSTAQPSEETAETAADRLKPDGEPVVLATGLTTPWSVVRLSNGSALISQRDDGRILEYTADGEIRDAGRVAGVQHNGEGGLLGLAVSGEDDSTLFAYLTTASENRIERMPLLGDPGDISLGDPTPVLEGLDMARNHNGGRIAFGPDGMLYATVGDAGNPDSSQDLESLNGKILRMTPDGEVPDDNPIDDSLVYSYGHRNPQGIAWDSSGQLFAAEFGQDTWDEFNRIDAGANYGWPVVEGQSDDPDYVNPLVQWSTDEASPSALTAIDDTFFLAALRGERLWSPSPSGDAVDYFAGEYGRIREVLPGPDGTLWLVTSNTDGNGSSTDGDDRLIQVPLSE